MNRPRRPGCRIEGLMGIATALPHQTTNQQTVVIRESGLTIIVLELELEQY